ncbi:MAG: hypothetical protein AAF942_09595 [Pseudomonadota bacterium]
MASSEATYKEVKREGGIGGRRSYIGEPGSMAEGPQAFLVERPYPNPRVAPHFHDVDQFQVIVAGDGHMGKKEVRPITFQYADAFTPYGPIVGRDDGINFFTIRAVASGGYFPMPGSKQRMPGRAGRNIAGQFDIERNPLPAGEVAREPLMEQQDDGVFAEGLRLGPDAVAEGLTASTGCQFYLVCSGTVQQDGKQLGANSLIHVEPEEAAPSLRAGPDGACVLALRFPTPSERPGSDPSKLGGRSEADYHMRPDDVPGAR